MLKSPPFHNTNNPFYRRRFRKCFQTRKAVLARKLMDKVWYLPKMTKKRLFSLVKENAPHLKHTIKKTRRCYSCSSLERLPTRLWLAFPLSFTFFGKDFKPKSGCFERKWKGKTKKEKREWREKRKVTGERESGKVWKYLFSKSLSLFLYSFLFLVIK